MSKASVPTTKQQVACWLEGREGEGKGREGSERQRKEEERRGKRRERKDKGGEGGNRRGGEKPSISSPFMYIMFLLPT